MSGQEEQSPQNQNENVASPGVPNHQSEEFNDLLMLASVQLPVSRNQMLLDYLYGNRISVVPIRMGVDVAAAGGGGGVGGGMFGGLYDIESNAASILARSLYDCCPVKKVITDEARCQIVDKQFSKAMVEELKINEACGIWQEDFEEGEAIKILPCSHAFKAEAIIKWLEQEKAECPICRSALESKEVIQNQAQNLANDRADREERPALPPAPEVQQDNDGIRLNNIASRLAQNVAGRANQYHQPVSVPMNRLIQSLRMASSSLPPLEPIRAAVPSSSGAAAPVSEADAGDEVRAEAVQYHPAPAYNNIINNYYYLNNLNDLNAINYINNINNNNNNNNNYEDDEEEDDEEDILDQEQADIEEAIRRSLL